MAREGTNQRRVKFVERGGETLKDKLCRNNPWSKVKCGRELCITCPSSKEGMGGECRKEGVVYEITCMKCKEEGVTAEYVGQSARTGQRRGCEHLEDL